MKEIALMPVNFRNIFTDPETSLSGSKQWS